MKLTIEQIEKTTGCVDIELFGIKTDVERTYHFELCFNDSNFNKQKGWLKEDGAKWDNTNKVWTLKTKRVQRYLVSLISNVF